MQEFRSCRIQEGSRLSSVPPLPLRVLCAMLSSSSGSSQDRETKLDFRVFFFVLHRPELLIRMSADDRSGGFVESDKIEDRDQCDQADKDKCEVKIRNGRMAGGSVTHQR